MPELEVKALAFDVFGTVVDWRSSVIAEGEALGRVHNLEVNWPAFADEWRRDGYHGTIARIRAGQAPWETVDVFMRRHLDTLVPKYGLDRLEEAELAHLAKVWHRLHP